MKIRALLCAFALVVFTQIGQVAPASAATGCQGGTWSLIHPGVCTIANVDQATSVGTYKLNPNLATCTYTKYGLDLASGFDYLSNIVLNGVSTDGILHPGTTLNWVAELNQSCFSIPGSYKVKLKLTDSKGMVATSEQSSETHKYRDALDQTIGSYCFYDGYCTTDSLAGNLVVPSNYAQGDLMLSLVVDFDNSVWTSPHPPIHAEWTVSNQLTMGARPTPVPPQGLYTQSETSSFGVACVLPDPSLDDVSTYGLTATQWSITSSDGSLSDSYTLPLGITAGQPSDSFKTAYSAFSSITSNGRVFYVWAPINQRHGVTYTCSVAALSGKTTGATSAVSVTAKYDSSNFVPTQPAGPSLKQITCYKGAKTKTVLGTNPKCPGGYRKK